MVPTGEENYKKISKTSNLNGLEDLLKLVKESAEDKPQFIKTIKKYLYDFCHESKSSSTMNSIHHAITSYFEKK